MEKQLTIIIPAYNEESSLRSFLPEVIAFCRQQGFQLIVVDDGSVDKTYETLKDLTFGNDFVEIIHHKVNRGYGGAIKTGIQNTTTPYLITIDADGQHYLEDVLKLLDKTKETEADMVIGSRKGQKIHNYYRHFGKSIIRSFAKMTMTVPIYDINSGMKLCDTALAQKYIPLCPDDMAYSDFIALIFINQKHLVIEEPIRIRERREGKSKISLGTAYSTILAIIHILLLFNPMRFFLPIALLCIIFGIAWGLPFLLMGRGVSNGAIISILSGLILVFLGLIADQISMFRKERLK
ncbi:MAG TPA: glycosyltransferase family 2 protein [Bacteroidales bacterium]|nr:glycosyltransferase family 2 protein [Bacteroidales bacterium]HOH83029.1 glycosyltransferase family 2 protein [Bacteroidales bacterium]